MALRGLWVIAVLAAAIVGQCGSASGSTALVTSTAAAASLAAAQFAAEAALASNSTQVPPGPGAGNFVELVYPSSKAIAAGTGARPKAKAAKGTGTLEVGGRGRCTP